MQTLRKHIASGNLAPLYFLCGPESFLKEEAAGLVRGRAFPTEDEAALNTTILHGQDVTLGEIVSRASEFPMFTERKLLIVRHFNKFRKAGSTAQQKQHIEQFARYCKNPSASTILILDADEIDRKEQKKQPWKDLDPFRHDFPLVKNPEPFAAERAKSLGWEFDPDALNALCAYIEPSAREISREVEKLVMFCSAKRKKGSIKAGDVLECVGISKQYNVFELEKAIAAKNLRQSSGIAMMIMEQEGDKEGLMNIVRYLTTFWLRVWKMHSPGVHQQPLSDIAKMLGMYGRQEFFAKNYLDYARRFTLIQTESALLSLAKTDRALKGLEPYPDEKFLLLRMMQEMLTS